MIYVEHILMVQLVVTMYFDNSEIKNMGHLLNLMTITLIKLMNYEYLCICGDKYSQMMNI